MFSQLVRESDDKEAAKLSADIENLNRKPWERKKRKAKADFPLTRFARASVEGAFQLFAYEASRDYVYALSPVFQNSLDKMSMEQSSEVSPLSALLQILSNLLKEFYSGSYNINTLFRSNDVDFAGFLVGQSAGTTTSTVITSVFGEATDMEWMNTATSTVSANIDSFGHSLQQLTLSLSDIVTVDLINQVL